MKKLIALIALALLGFYVAWPAWSGYRIYSALNARDAAALAGKVDFPAVRESMRPAITTQIDRELEAQMKQANNPLGGLLGGDIRKQLLPKMVEGVLEAIVTPENIIRIASEGDAAGSIRKILTEKMGTMAGGLPLGGGSGGGGVPGLPSGGLGQLGDLTKQLGLPGVVAPPAAAPSPAAPAPSAAPAAKKASVYGIGNIKGLGFDGPLGLRISVAQDATASVPDVTAGLSFTGGDWKLTKVIPRL